MTVEIHGDDEFARTGQRGKFIVVDYHPERPDVDRVDYFFEAKRGIALFDEVVLHRHDIPGECEPRDGDAADLEPWVMSLVMLELDLTLAAKAPEHMQPDEEDEEDFELDDPVEIEIE